MKIKRDIEKIMLHRVYHSIPMGIWEHYIIGKYKNDKYNVFIDNVIEKLRVNSN